MKGRNGMNRWISNRRPLSERSAALGAIAAAVLSGLFVSPVLLLTACQEKTTGASVVAGRVAVPLSEARIYIYREGEDIYGPALVVSEPSGPDGRFSLSLKPGRYIAVVRKRQSGDLAGPVLIGDYRSEPISFEVAEGRPIELDLEASVKTANEKVFPQPASEVRTGIAGTVTDADGKPVEGVRIHVYDHIQMSERPKYVGERTGADGRYMVPVKRGGTYYLAARDRFGGPPQLGDLFGRYDEGTVDPSGVVVRKGEVTSGIDIVVHRVW